MPDTNIEFEERREGGRRWFEPRFTLGNVGSIVATIAIGMTIYFGIVNRIDSQASEIAQLQVTVQQVPSLAQHMAVIDNTISINKAARDKAQDDTNTRLDRLTEAFNLLAQNVSALNATIKAQETRP